MSKIHHAIYLAIISTFLLMGCAPESADDAVPVAKSGVAVFSFVPSDLESEKAASDLTKTLIQSLEKTPSISVLTQSELPPSMQDPSNHHLWPESDLVSLILEGSVKSTEEGIVVTAQLIDASGDAHVRADTFVSGKGDTAIIISAVENQVILAASR